MRLVVVDGRSYLEGWCYRAEAMRLFRLDRMLGVEVLDVAADPPAEAEPIDVDAGRVPALAHRRAGELELTAAGRWVAEYYPCEQVDRAGRGPAAGGAAGTRPGLAAYGWRCAWATPAGWSRRPRWPSACEPPRRRRLIVTSRFPDFRR